MEFFTVSDFANMKITKMFYDEETRGWSFFVEHNGLTYSLRDFTLPHPDDVTNDGYIVSVVQQKMLSVMNKSTKEELKTKIDVVNDFIIEKPFTELTPVEYIKPEEPQLLEFDGSGYENFFLDEQRAYKGNINIILNLNSYTWIPGRYMKSLEWITQTRIVDIKGNKIKLYPIDRASESRQGTWEYWDGSSLNTLEYNGMITKDMTLDFSDGSKYNVHVILDTITMTWNYGPDNVDLAWIGQGKQISINGTNVDLKIGRSGDGFAWYYL